jgi:hypothetical protein
MLIPLLPDAELNIVRHVRAHFPGAEVSTDVPQDWDWANPPGVLILVSSVGGPGLVQRVVDASTWTFEVYSLDVDEASEISRQLFGVLAAWPHTPEGRGVSWRGAILRPTWHPYNDTSTDNPTRTPGYWFTINLAFMVEDIEI